MNNFTKATILVLGIAALPFLGGCGSSTEQVKETTSTTRYVQPLPEPAQVVVQPAPVIVSPPTTVTTTEEKSTSDSNDNGVDATRESSSAYHSESSTVTPMTAVPAPPPQAQSMTTYQKRTYEETN